MIDKAPVHIKIDQPLQKIADSCDAWYENQPDNNKGFIAISGNFCRYGINV